MRTLEYETMTDAHGKHWHVNRVRFYGKKCADDARSFFGAPSESPVTVEDHGADQYGRTFTVYKVGVTLAEQAR